MANNFSFNEYLVIDTTGSVGIGSTNPIARFYVTGSSTTTSQTTAIFRPGTANQTAGAAVLDVQSSTGTSLFFVSGSGNIGVGISNPTSYKLDVVGQIKSRNQASGDTTGITLGNNGTEKARIQFTASDDSARFKIEVGSINASSERISFYAGPLGGVATNEAMIIGGNGNVGIGTGTLATSRLLVTGSGATSSTSTMHLVNSSNTSLLYVRDDGNIGVGTTSPGYTLQIGSGATVGTRTLALIDSGYGIVIKGGNGNGIVQSLGTTVPLELQAGNGNNGNYYFTSTGNVGIGSSTVSSKIFVYTTQNDASTTPSFDFHGAFMRIGDYTTNLSFTNGVGIKIHDGGVIHYSVGQISGKFLISDTSNDGNALFPASRSDIIAISSTNVGIGTTLIDSKLVVNGNTVISGTLNPDTDAARDLGTSLKRWRTLFAANISGSLTPTGATAGSVFFAGASGQIQQDNSNFFWDDTNNRLGIGTATPTTALDVNGVVNAATGYRIAGGATNGYVLKGNGTNFVSAQLSYSELSGTPTIGDATLTVGVSGTGLSISATPTFTANATSNKTITITSNATSSNTVSTIVARDANGDFNAGRINVIIDSSDTRAVTTTPETLARAGVVFDFKTNGTNALTDGGSYHGLMTFRQYGSTTDWSGGRSHQLGFTDNDNVWHRSGTSTTWGTWYKFYHTGNLTNPTTGTGTTSYVARWTGTGTLGTGVLYDNATNAGVGTNSPQALLHVGAGPDTPTISDTALIVSNTSTTNLAVRDSTNNVELMNYAYSGGGLIGTATSHSLGIRTANSTAITIDTSQRVGIGTTITSNKLSIYDSSVDQLYIRGTSTSRSGIRIDNTAGYQSQILLADGGTDKWQFGKQTDNTFFLYDATATKNIIQGTYRNLGRSDIALVPYQDGRAGIGTDPSTNGKLEIYATGSLQGIYQSDGTRWMRVLAGTTSAGAYNDITQANDSAIIFSAGSSGTGAFVLAPWTTGTKGLRMDSSGQVGIGTATMSRSLVVNGSDALINDLTVGRGGVASNVGSSNTAIGYGAGASLTVGYSYNTSVGGSALATNSAGERNTALGNSSLLNYNPTASTGDSTAVGYSSLYNSTTGISNTAVGSYSLYSATTTSYNTAIGVEAMRNGIVMDRSVAVGYRAMYVAGGDDDNVAVGYQSAYSLDKGDRCTAIGSISLFNMKDNTDSTAVGYASLYANTGSYNTSMGSYSLVSNTTGTGNVAVGYAAGLLNSTASGNVAVGYQAMYSNTTASGSVGVGYESLYSSTGADNTAIGWWAGRSVSTGINNVAVGSNALRSVTSTSSNVAVGYRALELSTGTSNTALGTAAGYRLTTGGSNVAIGALALAASSTLSGSTAVGTGALVAATGDGNTGLGYLAGSSITSGTGNVVVGSYSGNSGGLDIRTSNNNIILSDGQGTVRMHIDYTGAVGIGTTTAFGGYMLHLYSGSNKSTNMLLQSDVDMSTGIYLQAGSGVGHFYRPTGSGNYRLGTTSSTALDIQTGGTTAINIDTSQNVGVGTTQPTLNSGAETAKFSVQTASDSLLATTAIRMHNPGGFGATRIEWVSDPVGSGGEWRPGYIQSGDGGTYTGKLLFYTNGTGSGNKWGSSLGMTVSNGSVGIGTSTPNTTYGKLHVWTSLAYGGNNTGRLTGTGNTITIVNSTGEVRENTSSRRFKKDIQPYVAGLEKILLLNPMSFKYLSDDTMPCVGMIAEDLHDLGIFEEFLTFDGEGLPSGIRYPEIVPLLINGIKELKSDNDTLKSEIQSLKDQISSILAMLSNK